MFDSGITVKALFEQINGEADIAPDVSADVLLQSYNGLIKALYRDIIKNEKMQEYESISESGVVLLDGNAEDVYRVYTEDFFELEKVNLTFALVTSRMCWYVSAKDKITLKNFDGESCYVVTYEIPEDADSVEFEGNVPVPLDFVDMVKAKIRGDMYNISNDDDLSSKWYGVYNTRLDDFRMWIAETKAEVLG